MRHFQVLLLAVLAVITVELGILIVKLPPPPAQATSYAPPSNYQPLPNPQPVNPSSLIDQFATLKGQHDQILQQLAAIRRDQASLGQQVTATQQYTERIYKYAETWAWTCLWAGNVFGDLDPQRSKMIRPANHDVCAQKF